MKQRKIIIGVMGPGESATRKDRDHAYQLGYSIAQEGWVLLTGGRSSGVMEAASQGAKAAQGLIVGILPSREPLGVSSAVDIAICTDLGNGRNNINVLSSDGIIAIGMGVGTASEVALALKNGKSVILFTDCTESIDFFRKIAPQQVFPVQSVEEAIAHLKKTFHQKS